MRGVLLVLALQKAHGFFDQMFGDSSGGGGGFQFADMNGQMMGGQPRAPKWPKGTPKTIPKKFNWMKGTTWNWNDWRDVQFEKDGTFGAPTQDCESGQCKWSASDKSGKVYILWGDSGLHELELIGKMPEKSDPAAMQNLRMKGIRSADGDRCKAKFTRIHDHDAADMDKDLYEILGLEDDAGDDRLKKAYRKLSMQYHPDKNKEAGSQEIFNNVRDAYEILSNPEKKILYDTGGMEAVKKLAKGEIEKTDDVRSEIEVALEDVYNGGQRQASMDRRVVCRACFKKPDLPKCRGCGRCPNEVRMVNRQMGPGMIIQQQEEVASKEKCKQETSTIDVMIEKGMRSGEQVIFPHMAEQRPGMLPGSVILTIKTQKHQKFERKGDDLHMAMKISLREALLGFTQKIRHMDGHTIEISTQSVTKPFQVFRVKGEGMPLRDDSSSFGDFFVKVEVTFPAEVNDDQYVQLEELLKPDPSRDEL